MEESEDLDLVRQDFVEDPIAVDEDLADGLLAQLWDDAPPEREKGERFRCAQDNVQNPFCRGGGVLGDVSERLVKPIPG